MKGGEKLD